MRDHDPGGGGAGLMKLRKNQHEKLFRNKTGQASELDYLQAFKCCLSSREALQIHVS